MAATRQEALPLSTFSAKSQVILARPPSIKSGIVYLTGAHYGKTFRLELNLPLTFTGQPETWMLPLGVKRRLPKGFVMKPNGLAKIRGTELQP